MVRSETRLIKKLHCPKPTEGAVTFTFTYGQPIISDIYDLGVPADAKIVEGRIDPEAAGCSRAVGRTSHQGTRRLRRSGRAFLPIQCGSNEGRGAFVAVCS